MTGLWRRGACVLAIALAGWLAACGGDDDGSGSAGSGPMVTPALGEPCTSDCQSGSVCSPAGLFPHQCSAQCSGLSSACSMLAQDKMTYCFGTTDQQCGLRCTTDAECPAGTHCANVAGAMGCVIAH